MLIDDFSEELLEQHEMELERLKAYASDNNTLYQLVERRDKLWQRLKEILVWPMNLSCRTSLLVFTPFIV